MARSHSLGGGKNFPNDRRRRQRLPGETQGWILPTMRKLARYMPDDEQAWEVRIYNVSRLGVGFTSTDQMRVGQEHRLRIGRGPMNRARLVRVVFCREWDGGVFAVGAEFVDRAGGSMSKAG